MQTHTSRRFGYGTASMLAIVYALLPVWWVVSLSFKPAHTLGDGHLIPREWTLDNYRSVFHSGEFVYALINSIGIASIASLVSVLLATCAAYAIARLAFPFKRVVLGLSLMIAMFPAISLVSPLFDLERKLGLFDTWLGLILPYITFSMPLAIYILTAFFREIPRDLERAAKMDGAHALSAFVYVIAPLSLPGVVTATILVFIFCWNDFLFAISLSSTLDARTVPAALAFFTGNSRFEQPTGAIAAAAVIITIPVVLFVLLFQRRIVSGLTSGAVKG